MTTGTNPFKYGPIALDDAFTNRAEEIAELSADALNGQDVVIFAPRRYGKTSLVHRVAQDLTTRRALVAEVNLWFTPTKEKLAGRLAREIADLLGLAGKAREAARQFAGLRIVPTMTLDPSDGSVRFTFAAGHTAQDVDDTLEHLLRMLPDTAVARKRPVVLVLDEFQEIVELDPGLTKLLRSVFQEQPEVGHIYLGSKRHLMERIFSDENEPFWRSAKRVELGPIAPEAFRPFIAEGFERHDRAIEAAVVDRIVAICNGHPYATQELCYFVWAETPAGASADAATFEAALAKLLRSEHSHLSDLWDRATANQRLVLAALAAEPGRPLSAEYRARNALRSASTTQKAIDALVQQEVVHRDRGFVAIAEPFFAEWIRDQQA
jgi:uncharacterized protein